MDKMIKDDMNDESVQAIYSRSLGGFDSTGSVIGFGFTTLLFLSSIEPSVQQ